MSVRDQSSSGGPFALAGWRITGIGVLRIVFGLVWAIDAWFKWQPSFINSFSDYLSGAQQDQPWPVHHWIGFWVSVVKIDPHVFAHAVAVGETLVALALIVGLFSNLTNVAGILISIVIWSTAEGFGGPYVAGSTDIGAAIIYVLVFAGLFLSSAGLYLGLDRRLTPLLGRFGWLASGRPEKTPTRGAAPKVALT
jgi:thiosulfate dehydrogenase [quinone] large subunit